MATAVAAAQAAFPAWSKSKGEERAGWLRKLAAATEANKEPLKQLEAVNVGRTINEMAGDLEDTKCLIPDRSYATMYAAVLEVLGPPPALSAEPRSLATSLAARL